jgi:hypothetical protein
MVITFTVSNLQQLKQARVRKTAPSPSKIPPSGEESSFSGPEKYIKHIIFCQGQMTPEQAVGHTSYSMI